MFAGIPSADKDPRKSIHLEPTWPSPSWPPTRRSSPSWPAPSTSTRCGRRSSSRCPPSASSSGWARRACGASVTTSPTTCSAPTRPGVVLRVGSAVRNWKPGDKVVVHCNYVDDQDPSAHDDSMLAANQRIWGYETNFGGLADLSLVKANQLMPKPAHLSWEEAAGNALCNSTSYRMLVSRQRRRHEAGRHRARLGRDRRPRRLRRPVRAERRGHACRRGLQPGEGRDPAGPSAARRSSTAGPATTGSGSTTRRPDESEWRRFGKAIRALGRRGPGHRVRASGPRDPRCLGVRVRQGRHDRDLRGDQRLSWSSTTTATCG